MKIFITGASGFVGTHLCERLLKEGHEIFALVRNPQKFKELVDLKNPDRVTFIRGDLNEKNLPWVSQLPSDLDACVHTAGIVHAYETSDFFKINTEATAALVEELKLRFSHLHFVFISSLAAAGPGINQEKKTELDLNFPVSLYGRSKKDAEKVLKQLAPPEWSVAIVRPPMVIGPRDSAVLDIFKMVKSGVILLPGINSKKKHYSFVCVFDLVETISKILELKKSSVYYSTHPHTITFLDLILEIKKQLKKRWILFFPLPLILVRLVALLLNFLSLFWKHSQRLTPDKYHELAASNWTCEGKKSEDELSQVYHYDLSRTIAVTLVDYQTRKWI